MHHIQVGRKLEAGPMHNRLESDREALYLEVACHQEIR
jgi:hypothetical protein